MKLLKDTILIIVHPDLACHHCAFIDCQERPETSDKYKTSAQFVILTCCEASKIEWDKHHELLIPAIKQLQKEEAMHHRSVIPTKNLH